MADHQGIDDNAYTNLTARWSIELAIDLLAAATPAARRRLLAVHRIRPAELARWKEAARAMLVPFNRRLRIIEQFPGFCRLKKFPFEKFSNDRVLYEQPHRGTVRAASRVAKQADMLQLFHLFPRAWPRDLMERCWDYYEPQTVHDSSLSFGAHAYVACLLDKLDTAWKFYRGVLDTDFTFYGNKYHVANGLHAANAGSAWLVAVLGFGGIYTDGKILECSPRLPRQLSSLDFTIYFQGRRCAFSIGSGRVKLIVDAGAPITLRIGGTVHRAAAERTALTARITNE